jgi:peptide/nickel transport system permease protein
MPQPFPLSILPAAPDADWTCAVTAFLAKRIAGVVASLLVISLILFVALSIVPGRASTAALGTNPSPAAIAAFNERYGLDRPLSVQYLDWLRGVVVGDFGRSYQTDIEIGGEVARRFPVTLELTFLAALVALVFAVPLALAAARYRRTGLDYTFSGVALAGLSMPVFAVATALVLFISLHLHWLPPGGYVPFSANPVQNLKLMILPAISLGLVSGGVMMRIVRAGLIDAVERDFAMVSLSRGASDGRVLVRHGVRVAAVPFLTFGAMEISAIFGGAVVIEQIFQLPGLGTMALQGIETRDYRVLQAAALVIATFVMVANLLVDLIAALIDPRLRRLATA